MSERRCQAAVHNKDRLSSYTEDYHYQPLQCARASLPESNLCWQHIKFGSPQMAGLPEKYIKEVKDVT